MLLLFGALVILLGATDPTTSLDAVDTVTAPVLAALELLLVLAVFRLFRPTQPGLARLTLAVGGSSVLAGVVAWLFAIGSYESFAGSMITIGSALTAIELVLIGWLSRVARAVPVRLWLYGLLSGIGVAAATSYEFAPSDWLVVPGLLTILFPWFLFRLSQIAVPAAGGATAR